MQYLILKVSLISKTYLVGRSEAVLLHKKIHLKIPILLHTEQTLYLISVGSVVVAAAVLFSKHAGARNTHLQ